MDYDNVDLGISNEPRDIDPLSIFAASVQRGDIEQLRGSQQDAVKKWHSSLRDDKDVLLSLDTGGGKSLVGLLIAQSLVNEVQKPVVYMCPTIQLVEQVANQAHDAGLHVDKYLSGVHDNEKGFFAGDIPCVTTYHAVFNGKSKFKKLSLGGAIFDDSHVAETVIRSCFTLGIDSKDEKYIDIIEIFREHFSKTPFATEFDRRANGQGGNDQPPLMIPCFLIHSRVDDLESILTEIGSESPYCFAWEHLRDHVSQLLVFIGNGKIEFTPWILPVEQCSPFSEDTKRLYLSATLPSKRSFIRAFGRSPSSVIEPEGKTNAAQRVFLIPPRSTMPERREFVSEVLSEHRTAVLVPTHQHAEDWGDGEKLPKGSDGGALKRFADSENGRLILVARYDGLDLPGDLCRALIVEGLPRGEHLVERFFADVLQLKEERSRRVADRLVQGLGRIFRSNRDHGIVAITDPMVDSWIRQKQNLRLLPDLLQKQFLFSEAFAKNLGERVTEDDWANIIEDITEGNTKWDAFYKKEIGKILIKEGDNSSDPLEAVVQSEAEIGSMLWNHKYKDASEQIRNLLHTHQNILSTGHKGMLHHLCGLSELCEEDVASASKEFELSRRQYAKFGRFKNGSSFELKGNLAPSEQAKRCMANFDKSFQSKLSFVDVKLNGDGGRQAADHHEALEQLGVLLGFVSSQPDKKTGGDGPDVMWRSPDESSALSMEAKTQKKVDGKYSKEDISQTISSHAWVREQGIEIVTPIIVGAELEVVQQATPPPATRIVGVGAFVDLADRMKIVEQQVTGREAKISAASACEEMLQIEALRFNQVEERLPGCLASDLKV